MGETADGKLPGTSREALREDSKGSGPEKSKKSLWAQDSSTIKAQLNARSPDTGNDDQKETSLIATANTSTSESGIPARSKHTGARKGEVRTQKRTQGGAKGDKLDSR